MLQPSFYYPRRASAVTHVETHISHLFFTDDLVYKIKKPVSFSFLDYSTLAKRKHFLHEELRLNRRLAPSVYLAVLPISDSGEGWQLGSDAHPVEYTLVMRRLPERRMLSFLLERGLVTPQMMQSIAETLVPFHAQAATGGEIDASGDPRMIQRIWEENLADIQPFVGELLDGAAFETVRDFGKRFVIDNQDLLTRRIHEGRIREAHGDLHCEHICFAPEGIQIFDCIEFAPRLRCCDIASEVAFLMMDLQFRGAGALTQPFLKRYLELTGDRELSRLVPFYKCYRALVRGKVAALSPGGDRAKASRYFALAYQITWEQFKPFLVVLGGLTGSGKSTLALELSRRVGWPVISSDSTRKALAGTSRGQPVPYGEGIYSSSMTQRTYAKMVKEAERLISDGEAVILDATFHKAAQRELALSLAARRQIPLLWIQCQCAEEVIQQRLIRREIEGRSISDGRWEIYRKQKAAFEPMGESPPEIRLTLDTEESPDALARKAEKFLRRTLSKGER